jgi:hypothetical protein
LLALVLSSVFAASSTMHVGGSWSSIMWGTAALLESGEEQRASDVCAAIKDCFDNSGDYAYVENYYGSQTTTLNVLSETEYCADNMEFAAVFYYGHSMWWEEFEPPLYCEHKHYYLYDEGAAPIADFDVGIYSGSVHDFVFQWTCGMANEQGGYHDDYGGHWYGMSAAWLQRNDLQEDSHDDPDYTGHCFIGFQAQSVFFNETTGYGYYMDDFVTRFYEYVTDDYSIDDALDIAADYFGSNYELEDSWI